MTDLQDPRHLLNGTITFEVPVLENLHLSGPTSQDNGGFPHSPDSLSLLAPDFAASADQLTDVPPTVPQQQQQQSPKMPCSDVEDSATVCQPAVEENSGKESQLLLSNVLPPELTEADKCLTPSHSTSVPSDPMIETELMFHEMERRLLLPDSLYVAAEHGSFQNTPPAPNSHTPGSPLATDAVEVNDNPKIPDTVDTQRTPAVQLESIEDAMLNRAASAGLLPSTSTDAREQSPTRDPLYDKLNLLGALLLTPPPPSEQEHPGDILPEPRLISLPETNRPLLDQDFLSCPDPSRDSMQDDTEERSTPSADLFPNFGEPDALGQQLRPGDTSGPPRNLSEVCGLGGKYPRRDVNWSTVSLCSSSDSVNGSQTPVDRVPLELTTFTIGGVGTDTPRALSPTTMGLLRSLVEQSQRHSQQMESVLARLSETQSQLSSLQQSHSQLLESLRRSPTFGPQRVSNSQSSASLFSEAGMEAQTPGSRQSSMQVYPAPKNKSTPGSTDECVIPNWGKQVLLQLRTQQGDFAKRFTQMEFLVNRLSSSLNELTASCKRFQPPTASTSQSSVRSEQLPKLLSDRMKPILKAELESAFANHIPRFIEPIQGTILRLVQDCSRSLPSALSDSLSHLLRDKNFCAQFSRTLSSSLTPDLCGAYRESLQQCFVPALEKNLNRLFEELTLIFRAGTQQYLDEIKKHLPSTLDAGAVASAVCAQLTSAVKDSITSAVLSLKADIHPIENKTLTHSSALASPVRATLGTTESVCITHRVGKAVVPSRAKDTDSEGTYPDGLTSSTTIKYGGQYEATPAPNSASSLKPAASTPSKSALTKKEEFARLSSQALSLIREGRLVDALELALVSTNQRLVLDVCGDIEPDQLFSSGNTQIGQNILLSLIHQLSCGNLSDQLDLKLRYLHEAVLSLNVRNSTTIEHGPRIIGLLSRRLEALLLSAASASGSTKLTPSTRARIDQLNQAAKNVSESINPG
ncbi:unnamed protein product [Dicrocoelium dendriticum]|nr:unnamed protein product [Dicrocoelium dendriticum]